MYIFSCHHDCCFLHDIKKKKLQIYNNAQVRIVVYIYKYFKYLKKYFGILKQVD